MSNGDTLLSMQPVGKKSIHLVPFTTDWVIRSNKILQILVPTINTQMFFSFIPQTLKEGQFQSSLDCIHTDGETQKAAIQMLKYQSI